jgi:CheY-like chemotaxis protein
MFDDILIFLAGGVISGLIALLILRFRRIQKNKAASRNTSPAPPAEPKMDRTSVSPANEAPGRLGDLHAQHLEAAARIREQRAASRAAREAKRIAAEEEARQEAQRVAEEEVIRRESQRIAAEEIARRDALRIAAEEAVRLEALRLATEAEATREAQRLAAAAEEAVRLEAQRIAAEEKAAREAQRIAAVEDARREVQRIAAEEKAGQEAQRVAAQAEAARLEAQRVAAEAEAAREAQKAAAAATEEIRRQAQSDAKPVAAKPPSETIVMIVDDSKVGRIKTNRFLINNHFQSQMAEDGCDALEKINAQMPDIVITDVEMPNMDGFELTKQIRSNPATAHIPVIIITGNNDGYEGKAKEVGADLVLGKPYSEENMVAQIHHFLRNGRPSVVA